MAGNEKRDNPFRNTYASPDDAGQWAIRAWVHLEEDEAYLASEISSEVYEVLTDKYCSEGKELLNVMCVSYLETNSMLRINEAWIIYKDAMLQVSSGIIAVVKSLSHLNDDESAKAILEHFKFVFKSSDKHLGDTLCYLRFLHDTPLKEDAFEIGLEVALAVLEKEASGNKVAISYWLESGGEDLTNYIKNRQQNICNPYIDDIVGLFDVYGLDW